MSDGIYIDDKAMQRMIKRLQAAAFKLEGAKVTIVAFRLKPRKPYSKSPPYVPSSQRTKRRKNKVERHRTPIGVSHAQFETLFNEGYIRRHWRVSFKEYFEDIRGKISASLTGVAQGDASRSLYTARYLHSILSERVKSILGDGTFKDHSGQLRSAVTVDVTEQGLA